MVVCSGSYYIKWYENGYSGSILLKHTLFNQNILIVQSNL